MAATRDLTRCGIGISREQKGRSVCRLADPGRAENAHMSAIAAPSAALSRAAFATLLLIAFMMGANHVAARVAFDNGVDVATAVVFRSVVTALVVGLLLVVQRVPVRLQRAPPARAAGDRRCWSACRACACIRRWRACRWRWRCWPSTPTRCGPRCGRAWSTSTAPEPRVLRAMPVMLLGLALALDVLGAASGLGVAGAVEADRRRRGVCAGRGGHLRPRPGADPARGGRPRRPRAHRHHAGAWPA